MLEPPPTATLLGRIFAHRRGRSTVVHAPLVRVDAAEPSAASVDEVPEASAGREPTAEAGPPGAAASGAAGGSEGAAGAEPERAAGAESEAALDVGFDVGWVPEVAPEEPPRLAPVTPVSLLAPFALVAPPPPAAMPAPPAAPTMPDPPTTPAGFAAAEPGQAPEPPPTAAEPSPDAANGDDAGEGWITRNCAMCGQRVPVDDDGQRCYLGHPLSPAHAAPRRGLLRRLLGRR
jgi:hypothetical protein